MALTQIPSLPTRGPPPRTQPDPRTVVRLRGDHDMSTVPALSVELASGRSRSATPIWWSISATCSSWTRPPSGSSSEPESSSDPAGVRSLSDPSRASARRLIEVCDLEDLVERRPSSPPMGYHEP